MNDTFSKIFCGLSDIACSHTCILNSVCLLDYAAATYQSAWKLHLTSWNKRTAPVFISLHRAHQYREQNQLLRKYRRTWSYWRKTQSRITLIIPQSRDFIFLKERGLIGCPLVRGWKLQVFTCPNEKCIIMAVCTEISNRLTVNNKGHVYFYTAIDSPAFTFC